MSTGLLIFISILVAIIIWLAFALAKKGQGGGVTSEQISGQVARELSSVVSDTMNQLVTMNDQKLKAEKQAITTDVAHQKSAIELMVKRVLEDMTQHNQKLEQFESSRIQNFTQLKTELENNKKLTEQLSTTTDNLRRVLSNNQLRGQFGEQVAEDLLKMTGFVRGTDYEFNKAQGTASRPDFSVFLPDGTRINVDAKFPYADLQRSTETTDEESKQQHLARFKQAVKDKIKQVTTRDYINPAERTVDFVILFIPNEMIFSFIYDKMNDIWAEAMKNKVVLAGPFSFTAILRMVRQSHQTFSYQQNTYKIIELIKLFEKEFARYNEEFEKIGARLTAVNNQYEAVDRTRTNKLLKTIEHIKLIDPPAEPSQIKPTLDLDE